ncbi:MAG: transposase, partial [Thermoanaerobaculia bacterium]
VVSPDPLRRGGLMKRTRFTEEQIIGVLHEAQGGVSIREVSRKHGITEQTFFRWRAKYGWLEVSEARRLKGLEDENRRLKKLVAELSLDNAMLKDVVGRKW